MRIRHLKFATTSTWPSRRVSRWFLLVLLATTYLTLASAFTEGEESLQQQQQPPEELEPANKEKPFASLSSLAVINGNVSLVCDISPPNNEDSVALILWYKDDSSSPIYTVDARKASSLEKAKTSISEPYANRAHFNGGAKPARLELNNVRLEDEGEFRCRVDFKRGRSVNTIIGLKLVIPPEEVLIVRGGPPFQYKPQTKLEGLIGPFDEGDPLTLVCMAKGGKPRPQITWRRDFNVIDDTQQHLDKEGSSNELKIPALSKTHLLSIFTCQVSNSNLTSPLQASITVDLNLKPQEVTVRQVGSGEPLVAGQAATFECTSHGSRPQATLHWMFRNKRIDTETNMEQQQSYTRLTMTMERSFNQLPLSCVAENPRMSQGGQVEQIIKLDVHYPPQANVELARPQNGSHLQEGIDVYLSCQLEANPRPAKPIVWRFNGKPLSALSSSSESSQHLVMSNHSLVLRKVARQQAGAYTCEASNSQGTAVSAAHQLDIKHAPACATDDILLYEIGPKQSVQLHCGVLANPANSVHYSWFLASSDEHNLSAWIQHPEALDEQVDESSSRLKLKPKHSSALIKCKAKNEIGLQQRACLMQVVEAREPKLKHGCTLAPAAATSDSLQVDCWLAGEQLKSEEFELTGGISANSVLGNWINLGTTNLRQQAADSEAIQPRTRSVHPPDWMLVELHRASSQSHQQQNSPTPDWQLFAYVVVGGSQQQLALIKSLVEENRLLSSAPRLVYYVTARAPKIADPTGTGNISDLRLPANFSFTVPQLEPRTSYRLLVYGQNLANRTRDWISLRGDTSDDFQRRVQQTNPPSASSTATTVGSGSSQHKKSIVPGSDEFTGHESEFDNYHPASSSAFAPEQINKVDPNSEGETEGLLGGQLLILTKRIQLALGHYSNQAISYARQRPMYAIPAFAAILVSTLFLLGWTGGRITRAISGRGAHQKAQDATHKKSRRRSSSESPPMKMVGGSPLDSQNDNSPPPAEVMSNSTSSTSQDTPPCHYHNYSLQQQHPHNNNHLHHHNRDNPSIVDEKLEESMTGVRPINNLNDTIYTIGRAFEACAPPAQMVGHKSANGYLTGSLDRCQQKQQPLYLATPATTTFHLSNSAQATQLASEQSQVRDLRRLELANSYAYNSGSFSSIDCSSAAHNGLATCRRSARVSFDLSNQSQSKVAHSIGNTGLQHMQVLANHQSQRQIDAGQQQHYRIYQEAQLAPIGCYGQLRIVSPDQLQQVFQQKGSDSGNTADSGHESPNTLNTLAETIGNNTQLQTVKGHHLQQQPHQQQQQQQQQQMLMLMELPTDTSASPSLLHTIDSFPDGAEMQQLPSFGAEFRSKTPATSFGRQQVQRAINGADQAAIGLPYNPCSHQQSTDISNWL